MSNPKNENFLNSIFKITKKDKILRNTFSKGDQYLFNENYKVLLRKIKT